MLGRGHATSLLQWHRHLPQLREVLQKAEFVSLDLEMTGIFLVFFKGQADHTAHPKMQIHFQRQHATGIGC